MRECMKIWLFVFLPLLLEYLGMDTIPTWLRSSWGRAIDAYRKSESHHTRSSKGNYMKLLSKMKWLDKSLLSYLLECINWYISLPSLKIKTALRSVLNELDEETEVLPHIKTSKDFEVYEPIVMHPLFQILPWDDNVKPTYELSFKPLL